VHGGLLDLILKEFQIVVSDLVIEELKKTSKYQDEDGKAAKKVLEKADLLEIRGVDPEAIPKLLTSQLDEGEASCVILAQAKDIPALISDDFKAMHQLQYYARKYKFDLGLGAVLIHALVMRGALSKAEALKSVERIAAKRDWIGRPIYRTYRRMLEVDLQSKP